MAKTQSHKKVKAKRSKQQKSKHDKALQSSANYYQNQGYKVDAALKGYNQPKTINGKRPDLIAKKQGKEIILEVETKKTIQADRRQQQIFKNYANKSKNRQFRLKQTK